MRTSTRASGAATETAEANGEEDRGRPCPACGARATAPWRLARAADAGRAAAPSYRLERCGACGSAWIADPPAESASLYEEGVYAPRGTRLDALVEPLRRLGDRDRLRCFGSFPAAARIHEIGSGDNRLLGALVRAGFRASGSEPARPYADAGRRSGLDVTAEAVETLAVDAESLDGVVLWHVLEHLDDPAAALRRVRGWLKPDGRVVVAVPNLSSVQAAIGGDRWFHQDVPRHRAQFTARGLHRLLERCGFVIERATTLTVDQSILGMWQTLLNRVTREPNVLFLVLKRQPAGPPGLWRWLDLAVTLVAAPLAAALAVPLELVAAATGRGGSAVVVARAAPCREPQ